ncbi:MAG: hypothetical protein K8R60_10090 [Burkholderiales bacterium]|nr:hypothetical protein [Burkholderiales bacterium]
MRRRWIGLVAALALLAFGAAQAIDFDPNAVYDLVEPAWRVEHAVRIVDARETPSAAARILSNGIRLGETQFRQPPPEALRQSLEAYLGSSQAQARSRELLTRGTVRLTRFEFRFEDSGVAADAARLGLPGGSGKAVDLVLRSLGKNKNKAGVAHGIVAIEVEAGGRIYFGNAAGKLTSSPTSATTRETFQAAVDDLVKALSSDPDAAALPGEPASSSKKKKR